MGLSKWRRHIGTFPFFDALAASITLIFVPQTLLTSVPVSRETRRAEMHPTRQFGQLCYGGTCNRRSRVARDLVVVTY